MINIENLDINVEDAQVLNDLSISFETWKNYALLWKNGSWKSSIALTLMWNPKYEVQNWEIYLDWESIKDLKPEERARKWIFLAFQNVPEIPGVKLFDFLKAIYNSQNNEQITFLKFRNLVQPLIEEVGLSKDFLFRDLNVWFSGWEKRKIEILQLKLLNPKYIILDEIDSGLDINSIRQLWDMLKELDSTENTFIIISHYFSILDYLNIDKVFVMESGNVKESWGSEILESVKEQGF